MLAGVSPIDADELRAKPALARLGDRALAELAGRAHHATVAAGDLVAGDGRPPSPPALIESGIAWVLRHSHRVTRLGPGELIGVGWSERRPRTASVVAATPMRLIVLPGLDRELRRFAPAPRQAPSARGVVE
jgi:hypothetical protein